MDPCEYAFSQQMVMRRLMSWLRQSQTSCSDIECFNGLPGESVPATATPESFMMMTVFCVVVGFILFMTRPSSVRNSDTDSKPRLDRSEPDNHGPDPSQSAH